MLAENHRYCLGDIAEIYVGLLMKMDFDEHIGLDETDELPNREPHVHARLE